MPFSTTDKNSVGINNTVWIYWTIILVTLLVSIFPYLYAPIVSDQGTHLYLSNLFLHGVVPYKDYITYQPPGVIVLFAIPLKLFGPSALGFRIFDCLVLLLAIFGLYKAGMKIFDDRLAGFWACMLYMLLYFHRQQAWALAGLKSHYMSVCLIWSLYFFSPLRDKPISKRWVSNLFCAILCGIAFWIKGTSAFVWMGFILSSLIYENKFKICKKTLMDIWVLIMGGLIPSFFAFGYFFSKGALGKMIHQVFFLSSSVYLSEWTSLTLIKGKINCITLFNILNTFTGKVSLLISLLAVTSIGIIFIEIIKNKATELKKQNIFVFFVFTSAVFLTVLSQGIFYIEHWYPFLFAWTIFAGYAVSIFNKQINRYLQKYTPNKQAGNIASVCFTYFLLILCIINSLVTKWIVFGLFLQNKSIESYYADFSVEAAINHQVVNYLNKHIAEDDYIYIWGDRLHVIGLFTDRKKIYTKYISLWPHFAGKDNKAQKELIKQLLQNKPKYLLQSQEERCAKFYFKELDEFIKNNYKLEKTMGLLYIWRLQ